MARNAHKFRWKCMLRLVWEKYIWNQESCWRNLLMRDMLKMMWDETGIPRCSIQLAIPEFWCLLKDHLVPPVFEVRTWNVPLLDCTYIRAAGLGVSSTVKTNLRASSWIRVFLDSKENSRLFRSSAPIHLSYVIGSGRAIRDTSEGRYTLTLKRRAKRAQSGLKLSRKFKPKR